jgi:hypothetical protein
MTVIIKSNSDSHGDSNGDDEDISTVQTKEHEPIIKYWASVSWQPIE